MYAITNTIICLMNTFFCCCFYILFFFNLFFINLVKLKPNRVIKELPISKNLTNFISFPYLDFELSLPQARKTGDFAILSNSRSKVIC